MRKYKPFGTITKGKIALTGLTPYIAEVHPHKVANSDSRKKSKGNRSKCPGGDLEIHRRHTQAGAQEATGRSPGR
jgi:hypothetical protein